MIAPARELAGMRAVWAQRTRQPPDGWWPGVPGWAAADRGLRGVHRGELWKAGEVDWGWLIMATGTLWKAGNDMGQGNVLYTDDVYLRETPGLLSEVADRIWAARETPPTAVGLRAFNTWVKHPYLPNAAERVPQPFAEGRVVWVAGSLILRSGLPGKRLAGHLVPIVRAMDHSLDTVVLAPLDVWAPALRARWEAEQDPG